MMYHIFHIKRIKTVNRLLYYSRILCHEMVLAFLTGVDRFRSEQESQLIFFNFKDAPINKPHIYSYCELTQTRYAFIGVHFANISMHPIGQLGSGDFSRNLPLLSVG
jgi:hypothetical protein